MKKIPALIALYLLLLFYPQASYAGVNVVATLPFIGSIASEIGKNKIDLKVLVKPTQDPHYVEAKPSMILASRKADIIMYNGLDLEIGYLPLLIESSKNPKIQNGKPGNFDCSRFMTPIEKPVSTDRSMGDVHPFGNPHYLYSPKSIIRIAEGMASALSEVDQANSGFYQANLAAFREKFNARMSVWNSRKVKGRKFIAYHKMFEYIASEFGLHLEGYIESKPGIPPSAAYIETLVGTMKAKKPDAILMVSYQGRQEADFLSQRTGVKIITLPSDVGSTAEAKDWFSMMDQILSMIE